MATYKGHNEDSSGNLLLSIGNGMTATVETGSTASQSYTKGAYVFFNNRFCKTTTSISSGSTLTIGSNLSETSIGAELTSHLRSSDGKEFYFDVKNGTYGYYPSASKVSSEFVPFGGTTQCKTGTATLSTSSTTTISCGFQPKYLCVIWTPLSDTTALRYIAIYNETINSSKAVFGTIVSADKLSWYALPNTSGNRLNQITSTGFIIGTASSSSYQHINYFAIG